MVRVEHHRKLKRQRIWILWSNMAALNLVFGLLSIPMRRIYDKIIFYPWQLRIIQHFQHGLIWA